MLHPLLTLLIIAILALRPVSTASGPPPSGWTPDGVPDAFASPTAALVWPGATSAFVVNANGNLVNGMWRINLRASASGTVARSPRRIAYEGRWLPVAHWTERAGEVRWDFEAVALPIPQDPVAEWRRELGAWRAARFGRADAGRDDVPLVVTVCATATNEGAYPELAALEVTLVPMGPADAFRAQDARGGLPHCGWWTATSDSAIAWSDGEVHDRVSHRCELIEPGQQASVRFVAASHPLPASRWAAWVRVPHDVRVRTAREWWTRVLSRGMHLQLGDPDVEAAVRAARVVLLSHREQHGERWVAMGDVLHAREATLADGARTIAALAAHGYSEEAQGLAESLLAWQQPSGAIVGPEGTLAGTGQALWALGSAMLLPGTRTNLAHAADVAYAAWSWCERTRTRTAVNPALIGLLAQGSIDGHAPGSPRVASDAWTLTGYTATERLLRLAGREADAERVAASRRAYAIAFARALARLPSRDLPPTYDAPGRDDDNLAVAYPCDALPVHSARLEALAQRTWSAARHPGLGSANSPDSLQGYVAADLATWAFRAGHRAEADAALEGLLAWRNASGAGAAWFTPDGDYGLSPPPNPRSAAALLQLVRNSLIDDEGDRLCLTQGARARWWRGARIDGAPTRWGRLSVAFERSPAQARWRWTAVPVWTELTLPRGTQLAGDLEAPLRRGSRPDRVLAPPGTQQVRLNLKAASPAGRQPPIRATAASRTLLVDSAPGM